MAKAKLETQFTVTRQNQWPEGNYVVEISAGGRDYVNPDALCEKYPGEFETFTGLTNAVETGIEIAEAWRKDLKARCCSSPVFIAIGSTGGNTLPFEGERANQKTYRALRKRAREHDAKLDKCVICGEILGDTRYRGSDAFDEYECCSEHCASKQAEDTMLLIDYKCPDCDHEWQEEWDCACDSECPHCGTENIQAMNSRSRHEVDS